MLQKTVAELRLAKEKEQEACAQEVKPKEGVRRPRGSSTTVIR